MRPGQLLLLLAAAPGQGLAANPSPSLPNCLPFTLTGPLRLYFPPECTAAPGAPQPVEVLGGSGGLTLVSEAAGQFVAFPLTWITPQPPLLRVPSGVGGQSVPRHFRSTS